LDGASDAYYLLTAAGAQSILTKARKRLWIYFIEELGDKFRGASSCASIPVPISAAD
jgi:hypothetical protein